MLNQLTKLHGDLLDAASELIDLLDAASELIRLCLNWSNQPNRGVNPEADNDCSKK
jgi:hypothetical protein